MPLEVCISVRERFPLGVKRLDRALGGGFLFAQLDELPVIGGILLHFVLDGLEGCLSALNVTLDLLAAAVAVRFGLFLRLFLAHGAFDRLGRRLQSLLPRLVFTPLGEAAAVIILPALPLYISIVVVGIYIPLTGWIIRSFAVSVYSLPSYFTATVISASPGTTVSTSPESFTGAITSLLVLHS